MIWLVGHFERLCLLNFVGPPPRGGGDKRGQCRGKYESFRAVSLAVLSDETQFSASWSNYSTKIHSFAVYLGINKQRIHKREIFIIVRMASGFIGETDRTRGNRMNLRCVTKVRSKKRAKFNFLHSRTFSLRRSS